MKRIVWAVALLVLVGGAWWARGSLFPGEAARVKRILEGMAADVSFSPDEGNIGTMRRVNSVVGRFGPDSTVSLDILGVGNVRLTGSDEIQQAMLGARRAASRLSVRFYDIQVDVAPDRQAATANLTATADVQGFRRNQEGFEAIEFLIKLGRREGQWVIQSMESVPTLKQ